MNTHKSRMLGNLRVKPCMSPNLARLIMAEVPHEKFLRMSNYCSRFFKPKNLFVFFNNAPQSKAVAVNKKRKIFSLLIHQHWRVPSAELTCPLHQFCICNVRLVLACTVASCVFAGTPLWNSKQPTDCQLTGGSPYRMSLVIQSSSIFLTSLSTVVDVC